MIDTKPFAAAGQTSVDTFFGLSGQAFESVEQLVALNLQTVKTTLAESAEGAQAALSAKTPDEFLKLQTAALQAAPQKAMAYGRQALEIITSASATQRAAAEAQLAEAQTQFVDALNTTLKNAPGSENTIALVKQAVAAANGAFESLQNASKQVTDTVSANVAKLTETAVEAPAKATRARAKLEA